MTDFEIMREIAIKLMQKQMPDKSQGLMRAADMVDAIFEMEKRKQ